MRAVTDNLDVILGGMATTATLTVLAFACAMALGILIAACRVGPVPPLRWFGTVWVELFRNTPLTVLMFLYYFGLPKVGFLFSAFVTAVVALSLYTSAFIAEMVRSGINALGSGQIEAARSVGLTFTQTLVHVVIPQALRTVVGPLGSIFSALIRNTSVAYTISVAELSKEIYGVANETAQTTPLLIGAAIAYLAMTLPSGIAFSALARRLAIKR